MLVATGVVQRAGFLFSVECFHAPPKLRASLRQVWRVKIASPQRHNGKLARHNVPGSRSKTESMLTEWRKFPAFMS